MTRERRLHLEDPCDNRWEDLEPTEGGRYCAECEQVVLDLMHLRERAAWRIYDRASAERPRGRVCVRMRADARDDAIFLREPVRRGGVGAMVLSAALAACGEPAPEPPPSSSEMVQPPPETAPEAPALPEAPAVEAREEPRVVEGDEGGVDHPAHLGEIHGDVHTRRHGRMGGAVARPRHPRRPPGDDPLGDLDAL